MTGKPRPGSGDQPPTRYPETTAPLGPDTSSWLMKSVGQLEGEVGGLSNQITSIEKKIDALGVDIKAVQNANHNHAKFIYAATILATMGFALLTFFGGRIWDLIMAGIQARLGPVK